MERLEITDVVSNPQLGADYAGGPTKVELLVTVAGQDEPVLLLMTQPVVQTLMHTLETGHRPVE